MIDLRMLFPLAAASIFGGPVAPDHDGAQHDHLTAAPAPAPPQQAPASLELVQYVADSTAFHVTSVLIVGATEALLIDTQYHVADARRVADQIAETGRRLKAIFITHPDHDHFAGAAAIVERFPGTPVYMTEAALHHFDSVGVADFRRDKARRPDLFADSVVTPQVLPSTHLTVDQATVEIIPDLQGDVLAPVNSAVWIPSLRIVIAGDLLFSGVHVWLAASDEATRARWRDALRQIGERRPTAVVPGHKPTVDTPDVPAALGTMIDYLNDFDVARKRSKDGRELVTVMRAKYPWKVAGLLYYSARMAFRQP